MTIKLCGTPENPNQKEWAQNAGNRAYKRGMARTVEKMQDYKKIDVIEEMRIHTLEITAVLTSVERGNPKDKQGQPISSHDQVQDLCRLIDVTIHVQSCIRGFASSALGLTKWLPGPVYVFSSSAGKIEVTIESRCEELTELVKRIEEVQAPLLRQVEEENTTFITPALSPLYFPTVLIRIVASYMG